MTHAYYTRMLHGGVSRPTPRIDVVSLSSSVLFAPHEMALELVYEANGGSACPRPLAPRPGRVAVVVFAARRLVASLGCLVPSHRAAGVRAVAPGACDMPLVCVCVVLCVLCVSPPGCMPPKGHGNRLQISLFGGLTSDRKGGCPAQNPRGTRPQGCRIPQPPPKPFGSLRVNQKKKRTCC